MLCWPGSRWYLRNRQSIVIFPLRIPSLLLWLITFQFSLKAEPLVANLYWQKLPPLPNPAGLGGAYAGVSLGKLLVAGGANFPDRPPWAGGKKIWLDLVYEMDSPAQGWKIIGKLPRPMAYGVSVTVPDGMICAGGSDAKRCYQDVFWLRWRNGQVQVKPLPALPQPMANGAGAVLGNTLYVAGGIETPESTVALHTFWALDLSSPASAWRELESWPGPARMLAVAATQAGAFYLASGTDLGADKEGKPVRHYLRDVYCYQPGKGWARKADMPRAAVAAPSPAPRWGSSRFLVLSGDDGTKLEFQPPQQHPGFAKDILAYDTSNDTWTNVGDVPMTQVTVPAVFWHERYVFPNGEIRPGIRTPEVWSLGLPDEFTH